MALTAENSSNAGTTQPKSTSNNLLSFINGASSSIQDAMVSKKKRPVNVRKFIQKRVKRLNDPKGPKSCTQTKSKSVLRKPGSVAQLQCLGSMSWPLLATPRVQTQGCDTSNYPSVCSPPTSSSYAVNDVETSFYQSPPTSNSSKAIDAELDTLLSELVGLDSQPSTRHNSQTGTSPSYTPQSTLESQVYLAEHPFSPPNSDCSDDVYDDSVYSSPVGSVGYASVGCSPPMTAADWPVQSSALTTCPVTSTVWFPEQSAVSGTGWLPHAQYSSFEQAPPMTPSVYELIDKTPYF